MPTCLEVGTILTLTTRPVQKIFSLTQPTELRFTLKKQLLYRILLASPAKLWDQAANALYQQVLRENVAIDIEIHLRICSVYVTLFRAFGYSQPG